MAQCVKCGRSVTGDEIGLTKKLFNRGATRYMCLTCTAEFFHCDEEFLKEKIRQFREMGCTLFAPGDSER